MNQVSLDGLLQRLEKLHPKFIDLSLERLLRLLIKLDNPHLKLPQVIHIAGTNGKGSTLSFIKQILIEHSYKVHCYISPHLESIEERFVISNRNVTKRKLYKAIKYVELINNNEPITFFEITTAVAFYLFSKSKADFLILETGLGGRLDATNVIKNSIIDIITPISYDHQEYLGKTLKKITKEKLGIIKKSSSIIIGKQEKVIENYILKKLKKNKNKKFFFGKNFKILKINNKTFSMILNKKKLYFKRPLLLGEHQIENSTLAIVAAFELKKVGYNINNNIINKALIKTIWKGRLEKLNFKNHIVYLDGAHNVAGAKQLANFLNINNKKTWLIFGMLNNKDITIFLKSLKKYISGVVAIKIPDEKNAFTEKEIYKVCKKLNILCVKKQNTSSARNYLLQNIRPERILVTGSLYLIAKIRKLFI